MTAKTLGRNLEILEKYRKYADMVELRVDCLDPDERLLIRRFPEQAGIPGILTIRRDIEGGCFVGGEGARISLMARGLAYAETDRRRNFAYIDLEEDLNVSSLEEAARTFGTRIIRSYHNIKGTDADLPVKLHSMRRSGDEIVKVSVMANSTRDVLELLCAGKECEGQEKILISMGHFGIYSRILSEQFGSFLSYCCAPSEPDAPPAAPGQIEVRELASLYHFRSITRATKIYGVTGYPLKATSSPHFFNTTFELEGNNAVYVPFPADSITDLMEISKELNVEGLSVTVPYKEAIIPFLDFESDEVRIIGACNTLTLTSQGWLGSNTDARGFSDSLLVFLGRQNFKRRRVTVIGAGGAARAVVYELYRLGAKVLILNRTVHKARRLAVPYKFDWGGLDEQGIEKMEKYCDIIIQTTSAGMEGIDPDDSSGDPVAGYSFCGREEVMDLVYRPKMTPFLKRASNAGCNIQNGYDMLIRQARYQYTQFTGKEFPEHFLSRVQFGEV
jgi:3-dehydroquinate dehydratase/shikimate dehydrogenase